MGVPTKEETRISELFRTYQKGWTDGAKNTVTDVYAQHQREDIREMYWRAHRESLAVRGTALSNIAKELGYDFHKAILR